MAARKQKGILTEHLFLKPLSHVMNAFVPSIFGSNHGEINIERTYVQTSSDESDGNLFPLPAGLSLRAVIARRHSGPPKNRKKVSKLGAHYLVCVFFRWFLSRAPNQAAWGRAK